MKSIGIQIRDSRKEKNFSLSDVEEKTKIKKEFIKSIESEKWEALPGYPVVTGFVKSIAGVLDLPESQIVAMLRRDYPPEESQVNPKPDVFEPFRWSPRLTFILGIVVTVLLVLGYLIFQYINFIKPPVLNVISPIDGIVVKERVLDVAGTTDPEATVRVNNQPVIVEDDGAFDTQIEVFAETREIVVKSTSRSGKETEIRRSIVPELK